MAKFKHAKEVSKGDVVSAMAHSEIVRVLSGLVGGGGTNAIWDGERLIIRQRRTAAQQVEQLGIITATDAQDGFTNARWTYTIAPAQFNNDDEAEAIEDADEITAINLLELDHAAEPAAETAWIIWGVDAHQDGLSMTPTSVPVNAVVYYRRWTKPDGSLLYTIDRMGGYTNMECES